MESKKYERVDVFPQNFIFPTAFDRLHCHLQRAHHLNPQPAKTYKLILSCSHINQERYNNLLV